MNSRPNRRRVLQLTGVGAAASLAGCSQFNLGSNDDVELEADEEPEIDPADGITARVHPPEEELQEIESEVVTEVQEGEIDEAEMNAEYQERVQELSLSSAVEFESDVADDDEVSVAAGIGEMGTFLLEAPDDRLVTLLREGDVDALERGSAYEDALAEWEQFQEQPDPGEQQPEEPPVEDGDGSGADDGGDDGSAENESDDE